MITADEYCQRRKKIREKLSDHDILLVFSTPMVDELTGLDTRYIQDRDFLYLTGSDQPHGALLITYQTEIFYCTTQHSPKQAIWHGLPRNHKELARANGMQMDQLRSINLLFVDLPQILSQICCQNFYYDFGKYTERDQKIFSILRKTNQKKSRSSGEIHSLHKPGVLIHELRLKKSKAEIFCIKESVAISIAAHKKILMNIKKNNFSNEAEIHALLEYEFLLAQSHAAYPSIVAGDDRGTILHYSKNNQPLKENSVLLIDAAAQKNHYPADITRTWIQSGKFTEGQALVYDAVRDALQIAIKLCRAGNDFSQLENVVSHRLIGCLIDLDILKGSASEEYAKNQQKKIKDGQGLPGQLNKDVDMSCDSDQENVRTLADYYPHKVGHWLGLDVHDVGSYLVDAGTKPRTFVKGMVLTVEPGLYFRSIAKNHPLFTELNGLAIRLEEMILITDDEAKNLTADLPLDQIL